MILYMKQPVKVNDIDIIIYTGVCRMNDGIGGEWVMRIIDFHMASGASTSSDTERTGARPYDKHPDIKRWVS